MEIGQLEDASRTWGSRPWWAAARGLGRSVRSLSTRNRRLLVVGTPAEEPWHLVAHLADAARRAGTPELAPTLVRWQVPPGAPPHLAVGLDRLAEAGNTDALLVVAPDEPPDDLLERVDDARRDGVVVLAVAGDAGDELTGLADDAVVVPGGAVRASSGLWVPTPEFEVAGHVVSAGATEKPSAASRPVPRQRRWFGRRSFVSMPH